MGYHASHRVAHTLPIVEIIHDEVENVFHIGRLPFVGALSLKLKVLLLHCALS